MTKESEENESSIPRFFLSPANSSANINVIAMGLLVALRRKGLAVGSSKLGPSLTHTTQYRRITERYSLTLDPWILDPRQMRHCLNDLAIGVNIACIVGDKPLFDSHEPDSYVRCDADLARMFRAPVVLLFDAHGYRDSVGALIHGYATYHPELHIAGVIAENVENEEHNRVLKRAVESLADGPCYLGGIPNGAVEKVESRSSIHNLINSSLVSRNQLLEAAQLMSDNINLDQIIAIANNAPLVTGELATYPSETVCRIAVADDAAFGLTFQNNLHQLRLAGAELVNFSPLADLKLPKRASGLYFPSGYIDLYAKDLGKNTRLIEEIRQFVTDGGCIYGEGNGVAFLCKQMTLSTGETVPAAGILNGTAVFVDAPREKITAAYCQVETIRETVLAKSGEVIRAIREPRMIVRLEASFDKSLRIVDRSNMGESTASGIVEGLSLSPRIAGSIVQMHWGSNTSIAPRFVDHCVQAHQLMLKPR